MADPIGYTNATLVPASGVPPESVTSSSINPAVPASPSGDPIDPVSAPVRTGAGPALVSANTSNGAVVTSINNAPINTGNSHFFTPGQPAVRSVLKTDGSLTLERVGSAPAGDVPDVTFNEKAVYTARGDIISDGYCFRHFYAATYMHTGGTTLDYIGVYIPFGKFFTTPPASVTFTYITTNNVFPLTLITKYTDGIRGLIEASDVLTTGNEYLEMLGYMEASQ